MSATYEFEALAAGSPVLLGKDKDIDAVIIAIVIRRFDVCYECSWWDRHRVHHLVEFHHSQVYPAIDSVKTRIEFHTAEESE